MREKMVPPMRGREVAAPWREVEAVAAALLARGRPEALDIYRVVAGVR